MIRNYTWNEEKNLLLKQKRGVSFEQIVTHILQGDLLLIKEHPNQERYPGQQMFVVRVNDYVYLVPFVEKDNNVFLKTIFPSRKETRKHLRRPNK
jgi:uncharacterized DUF497 family protein